ncbi:galactosylceramide sulfotransferase-like [Lycorma delicatula]|uniref:galactosylceramide sulfotransferase-like n=1 Tax=Lycorma delicatula TaxID=130591 RepID=UPI003F513B54
MSDRGKSRQIRPSADVLSEVQQDDFSSLSGDEELRAGPQHIVVGKIKTKKPKKSLFFLKTHKCGSTTVQNIIMRFGLNHGLYFVLPYSGNYLGNPQPFDPIMINKFTIPQSKKFDIFAHHTRYNYTSVKKIMKDNAAFVTILRDPADVTESLFSYYGNFLNHVNSSFADILKNPRKATVLKRYKFGRYGNNQMLFDLGLHESLSPSVKHVNDYIEKIDYEFDLVMIAEYMEASMVLFANLMRWSLEDVVFLNLNSRNITARKILNLSQRKVLHEVNNADWLLYNYFLNKFYDRINEYGKAKMLLDVSKLIALNIKLKADCVAAVNTRGYAKTISYKARNNDWLCVHATKNELAFTNEIRAIQIERLKVLNKLKMFMYNNKTDIF